MHTHIHAYTHTRANARLLCARATRGAPNILQPPPVDYLLICNRPGKMPPMLQNVKKKSQKVASFKEVIYLCRRNKNNLQ